MLVVMMWNFPHWLSPVKYHHLCVNGCFSGKLELPVPWQCPYSSCGKNLSGQVASDGQNQNHDVIEIMIESHAVI